MSSNVKIKYAPSVYKLSETLEDVLFPSIQPYQEGHLQVSDLHSIWYAQYGKPDGAPVIFLHGGPGVGCWPNDMRYFDPNFYRIILVDQRGAKRSLPFGELRENNTQNIISDIEKLREHLGIKQWLVLGGSWGSALALLYGEAHPNSCLGFILRGVFLATKEAADNIWSGMGDIFPEVWEKMSDFLPANERGDLIAALTKRFMDPDPVVAVAAGRSFMEYDLKAGLLMFDQEKIDTLLADEKMILGTARMFSHFYENNFFIRENQILNDISKIKHLPAIIVHGRYDIICRLQNGYTLAKHWPNAELVIVPDAGHTAGEPGIAKQFVVASEQMKTLAY